MSKPIILKSHGQDGVRRLETCNLLVAQHFAQSVVGHNPRMGTIIAVSRDGLNSVECCSIPIERLFRDRVRI